MNDEELAFSHLTTRSDCEKEERCFRERIFFKQRWNQKIEIRSQLIDLVFYKCQNDSAKLERFFDVLSYGMNIVTCIEEDEGRSNTSLLYYTRDKIYCTSYTVYHIQYTSTVFDVQLLIFTWQKSFDREKGTPPDFVNFIQVKNPFLLFKRILYLIISGKSFLNFKPRNHIFNKMKFGKNYQTKVKLEKYFLYCWAKDQFTQWTIG